MLRSISFLSALSAGAGFMYLFDPERGLRRRALIRDQLRHAYRLQQRAARKGLRDLRQRGEGVLYRLRTRASAHDAPDEILVERVRSAIGRYATHPGSLDVRVRNHRCELSGPVLAKEADQLLSCVRSVPGIHGVEDKLERHATGEAIPGLQGRGVTVPRRRALLFTNHWMPAVRLVAGSAGIASALLGLKKGGLVGTAVAGLGGALVARAVANMPLSSVVGIDGEARGIELQKTCTIYAPVERVYAYFRNFENFPRFMEHVEAVSTHDGHSTWTVRGLFGTTQWDATVTKDVPNERLAWRTLPGAHVMHTGQVRFERAGASATRLDIHLSYQPPAGALGHAVASLFRVDPKHALDEDLVRFKSLVEGGKTRAHGQRVATGDLVPFPPPSSTPLTH